MCIHFPRKLRLYCNGGSAFVFIFTLKQHVNWTIERSSGAPDGQSWCGRALRVHRVICRCIRAARSNIVTTQVRCRFTVYLYLYSKINAIALHACGHHNRNGNSTKR